MCNVPVEARHATVAVGTQPARAEGNNGEPQLEIRVFLPERQELLDRSRAEVVFLQIAEDLLGPGETVQVDEH